MQRHEPAMTSQPPSSWLFGHFRIAVCVVNAAAEKAHKRGGSHNPQSLELFDPKVPVNLQLKVT